MENAQMSICVIIGRGGSERVPRKNIRLFCDKPMIYWPIKAIQESGLFERIIVSTEDLEIIEVAKSFGVDAPFIRPASLANSTTSTLDVVRDSLTWLNEHGEFPKVTCCAYASSPFINAKTIKKALEVVTETEVDYAFPVVSYPHPVQRAFSLDQTGHINLLQEQFVSFRTQDLTDSYHDAGQFYCGRSEVWLEGKEILASQAYGIPVSRWEACDIDTMEDWRYAEKLFALSREPK
jgi:pseudaminic acid cytidylyltransferase